MPDTLQTISEQLGRLLEQLGVLFEQTDRVRELLNALGWAPPPGLDDIGLSALDFSEVLEKLQTLLDSTEAEQDNELLMAQRVAELGLAVAKLVNDVRQLAADLPGNLAGFDDFISRSGIVEEFPKRMFDFWVMSSFAGGSPLAFSILHLLNIFEYKHFEADEATFQVEHVRAIIHFDHFKTLLDDPAQHFQEAYGWGTPKFVAEDLINRLSRVLLILGTDVEMQPMGGTTVQALTKQTLPNFESFVALQSLVTLHEELGEIGGLKVGCVLFAAPPTSAGGADGGMGFVPVIKGQAGASIPFFAFDDTFIDLSIAGELLRSVALILRPNQDLLLTTASDLRDTITGRFALGLRLGGPESAKKSLFSFPGGLSFETQQIYLMGGMEKYSERPSESFVEFGLLGCQLAFSLDDADSFLQDSIAQEKVEATFDVRVGWTSQQGIVFQGSGSLLVSIPVHRRLGPFTLSSVTLGLNAADEGLALETSVTGSLSLGPLLITAQRLGLQVDVELGDGNLGLLGLAPRFKTPSALGLSIDGGGFKGGGFLEFEPEEERYSGMLELEFQDQFTLKAFGLLNTRLPNGQSGFSLLIIISAEFTPIQLGLGFKLNGVGGLLGLNRTINIEPLRAGLRANTLSSILFPTDVVANADRIISDLKQVFPPLEKRFIFGPMAKIAWGTPTLVTVDLGLVIEIPDPVRLVILGVLRAVLPDERAAILQVQVNFLGEINFERRQLKFDASLFDSKLLGFDLSGDMAIRLDWGADANFLLTVGGFHPAYEPPPMDLPAIRRLTLSLMSGDNPRLRLEMYFAVTSNTAQFGAKLELHASASAFNVYGFLSFDVLFQFNPFYFIAEITAMLALRVGSSSFASIKLTLTLEGPTPWKAKGTASFKICWFFTLKVRFNKTFGETRNTTLPDLAVLPLLVEALRADDNWEGELPARRHRLESIREAPELSGELLLHPVGTLKISQKVVPLNVQIDRIGSQRPSDGREFQIVNPQPEVTTNRPQEAFAPAQFFDLTDEQKLTSASFKDLDSGVRVGDAAQLHTGYAAAREVKYEVKYIDSQRDQRLAPPRGNNVFDVDAGAFNTWTLQGAIAQSRLSFARQRKSSLAPEAVVVSQEPFAIVNNGDLQLFDASSLLGSEHAAVARLNELTRTNPNLRGTLQVVPAFELAA
jgi:hypothetical protein